MQVKIETYRNFEILFDTDNSEFSSELNDFKKGSKSFDAVKKAIDEYIKENNTFQPFEIIGKPSGYKKSERLTVVGIRKDKRFIAKNAKGELKQITDFEEKDYILYSPEMEKDLVQIAYLETIADDARQKLREAQNNFIGTNLSSVKSNYIS